MRSRGLAIVAVAALIGAALGAAVTLPALIVSGDDSPPAALSLAQGSKRVVVRASPLPAPRSVTRRLPSELAPPAPASLTQSPVSVLNSAPVSTSRTGTTGSGSRTAMGTPRHAKPTNRAKRPVPTVPPLAPPPPPTSQPTSPQSNGHKDKASKKPKHERGSKRKHKEKDHGHGHDQGDGQKEHGHGHKEKNQGHGKGEGQKEHGHGHGDEGDKGHGPKR
jgi:hypothetical protein